MCDHVAGADSTRRLPFDEFHRPLDEMCGGRDGRRALAFDDFGILQLDDLPSRLLILTVAEFLYHGSESSDPPKAAPLLFDEAFYGIDAARRDQLLAFADDLGLQLFVSSPDQDGVKREIKHSVSLIVVKDENLDVHLSPIHWNNTPSQGGLFGDEGPAVGMTMMEETR